MGQTTHKAYSIAKNRHEQSGKGNEMRHLERNEKLNIELMFSSKTDQWSTPQLFFDTLNQEFNFTLDPCCDEFNKKCNKFYTKKDDGLLQNWGGETVFCNPPYGRILKDWVKKCSDESKKRNTTIVMLIPARTDTKYFHDYIYGKSEIRFIKGRLKFGDCKNAAPFPSMIVIFKNKEWINLR